ncbi:hypothetical protein TRFO_38125 [Tritrichomonas foetus]|uniref:Uncharacterized protein n=1 Tax=Tritrichomonas foetus TaxID=1144522 RepID=A0A1J4JEA1_9EUKA|nr:hypothetical protein TRFO_38125 [Tritrichomonas foetus]|eukprot:OHS95765.1 hypothetical protein TRFO_38125 [Tritrichomonas foetus]
MGERSFREQSKRSKPAKCKRSRNVNENEEHENVVEKEAEPQIQYVSASNYFDSDDDGEIEYGVPAASKKTVVHIPEQYAAIIAEKREKNVEVRTYNDDEDNNGLETGFLNTQEALKSRQEYRGRSAPPRGASRGAPRGRGRGGRGRGAPRGAPRGGRGRNPNGRFNGEENDRQAPATPEERPHHDGQHGKGPRDRRVGNVQHQRNS